MEIKKSFERDPTNLKENLGAKLLNAPKNLENFDVGMQFQLKMLEFMDFLNQKLM